MALITMDNLNENDSELFEFLKVVKEYPKNIEIGMKLIIPVKKENDYCYRTELLDFELTGLPKESQFVLSGTIHACLKCGDVELKNEQGIKKALVWQYFEKGGGLHKTIPFYTTLTHTGRIAWPLLDSYLTDNAIVNDLYKDSRSMVSTAI